jgi:hypothetical protein
MIDFIEDVILGACIVIAVLGCAALVILYPLTLFGVIPS